LKLLNQTSKSLRRQYVEEENPLEQREYPKTRHPQTDEKYVTDRASDCIILYSTRTESDTNHTSIVYPDD